MRNKERLVELLKDNEVCRECGKKICVGCNIYPHLWAEAEMLSENGVFCPPVKIGDKIFFVYEINDKCDDEKVAFEEDVVVDVSVLGCCLSLDSRGTPCDWLLWEELEKKEMFFADKCEAEKKYNLLMQK